MDHWDGTMAFGSDGKEIFSDTSYSFLHAPTEGIVPAFVPASDFMIYVSQTFMLKTYLRNTRYLMIIH